MKCPKIIGEAKAIPDFIKHTVPPSPEKPLSATVDRASELLTMKKELEDDVTYIDREFQKMPSAERLKATRDRSTAKKTLDNVNRELQALTKTTKPLSATVETAKVGAKAKEPWEMTRKEWLDASSSEQLSKIRTTRGPAPAMMEKGRLDYGIPDVWIPDKLKSGKVSESKGHFDTDKHQAVISKALSEGKPVPESVLKDYPELAKAEEKPTPKVEEKPTIEAKPVEGVKPTAPTVEGAVTSGTVPHPSTETGAVTIPSGMGTALKEKGTSMVRHIKEFFSPTSTLPEGGEWYRMARYKGLGDVDRAIGIGTKVFDKLKKFSPEDNFNMFQAADARIPMSDLPANQAFVATQMRNLNKRIGQMAVKRDILKEATYEANKDSYVKYLYLRHILPDDVQIKVTGGKIDFGWLKSRQDLTRETQRGIGLIEDLSVAEPYGVMTSLGDMAKWDFFNTVAQDPRAVWTPGMVEWKGQKVGIGKLVEEVENQRRVVAQAPNVPEAQARLASLEQALSQAKEASGNVPEGFVQMPVSKSYGNLSGAFVAKPVFQDIAPVWQGFNSTGSTSKLLNAALNAERKAMAGFKVGKVALNLPPISRNVGSNFFQLAMSGMSFEKIPVYMERGLVSMLKKDATWNQARRYGLFKTNWGAAEIGEVLDMVRTLGKERTGIFGMLNKLAKYYGKIDDITKMAKFTEQLEKGVTPAKAAIEAHKWGMDYSLANPTIKVARQHIAPFISYQYKIAPLIAETMKKRPWLIPSVAAIPYIMSDVSRRAMNITDEEWKKLKKDMPLYIKENQTYTLLPWKSKEGNPQWVNIEYFLPWQNFIAMGSDIKNAHWGDIPRDFGIGNPIFNTISAWSSKGDEPLKDPFTRRPVYNTLDSPTDKAFKVSEWLMQTWGMPSMLSTRGAAGYTQRAASGEADKYGRTVTPGQAAARWFGVNVIAPSPLQSVRERRAMAAELKGSLMGIMKDPSVSSLKKQAAQNNYLKRMQELQGEE
jgi:hypothetical protein